LQAVAVLIPPLRILLIGRVFQTMTTGNKRKFGGRVRVYALYLTTLAMVLAAILVVAFERDAPGANITSFGDAIWWTSETVSTVGYGDFYPVTPAGRIVAIVLFVNGIALLSAVTATIAERVLDYDDENDEETDTNLVDLNNRLISIEKMLTEMMESARSGTGSAGSDDDGPKTGGP
jgi:voltage-gated potassium channel